MSLAGDPPPEDRQLHFPVVEVSAALIFRGGRVLLTRRQPGAHLGGLWEFPGGKREPAESFEQCLLREIREELGVTIHIVHLLETVRHTYPEKHVLLKFFVCRLPHGEPQPLDCAALAWARPADLDAYPFPAADAQLLLRLKNSESLWHT